MIEDYQYGSFSFWKLFAPNGESSVIYPIALIRLVTEPFGLDFSTVYLALAYALLYAAGTYVLVRSCAYLTGWLAAFPGLLLAMAAASPNLAACFNSLYPTAAVIVGLLLMTAMALRLFTYAKRRLLSGLFGFLAAAAFCLNSSELSLIFAPFAVAVTAAALVRGVREEKLRLSTAVCAAAVLLAAISSSSQYLHSSTRNYSDASAYHAAFLGFLEASDDPAADLAEFGLDESYLPDVGKSYYLSPEAYSHDPRDSKQAQALFGKLNADTAGTWYLRHPLRLLQTVNRLPERYNHFESDVALLVGQTNDSPNRVTRSWSVTDTLMKMFLPKDYSAAMLLLVDGNFADPAGGRQALCGVVRCLRSGICGGDLRLHAAACALSGAGCFGSCPDGQRLRDTDGHRRRGFGGRGCHPSAVNLVPGEAGRPCGVPGFDPVAAGAAWP